MKVKEIYWVTRSAQREEQAKVIENQAEIVKIDNSELCRPKKLLSIFFFIQRQLETISTGKNFEWRFFKSSLWLLTKEWI